MNWNDEQIEKVIREYLPGVLHMSLATCVDGKPWVCEVHYAFDDNLNLYFRSLTDRRHSKEIEKNPFVAGNIVEQHTIKTQLRGVYFDGQAERLNDVKATDPAYLKLSERLGIGPKELEEAKRPDGHQFYKISVDNFYVFDSRQSKPSQKYSLPWNKKT